MITTDRQAILILQRRGPDAIYPRAVRRYIIRKLNLKWDGWNTDAKTHQRYWQEKARLIRDAFPGHTKLKALGGK